MKNWSRYLKWNPSELCYPESENEIIQIVHKATKQQKKIRIIGSGHSFTPLCKTDDFLISLDQYQGLIHIDKATNRATVKAGTKLHLLNELLHKEGLALENMGDINVQSIAGAISTGTHGTGTTFGNISTQITKLQWINGLGEIITCDASTNPTLFKAAQISLGAFGILTEITLQCVPSYKLELKVTKKSLNEVLEQYPTINKNTRNYEFYWFPNTPYVMSKELNITDKKVDKSGIKEYLQEMVLENYAFQFICNLSYYIPSITRGISRFAASTIDDHQKTNYSHLVFSTQRIVRFNEMEYNIPIEAYVDVKKELVNWVNKHNYDVMFPIENRFVKGDDIYLSPAYQRDSAYIAVHVYHKKNFKKYFEAMESIFKAYNGRPHWGKIHQLSCAELSERYPMFEDFNMYRNQQDPKGLFLSPYLNSLFSIADTSTPRDHF